MTDPLAAPPIGPSPAPSNTAEALERTRRSAGRVVQRFGLAIAALLGVFGVWFAFGLPVQSRGAHGMLPASLPSVVLATMAFAALLVALAVVALGTIMKRPGQDGAAKTAIASLVAVFAPGLVALIVGRYSLIGTFLRLVHVPLLVDFGFAIVAACAIAELARARAGAATSSWHAGIVAFARDPIRNAIVLVAIAWGLAHVIAAADAARLRAL